MSVNSLNISVKETDSFKRIFNPDKGGFLIPIPPKGYYIVVQKIIWIELMKLKRARRKVVLKEWLKFLEDLHYRRKEAWELWKQIEEIKKKEWEKVLLIPASYLSELFPNDKLIGLFCWRKKSGSIS